MHQSEISADFYLLGEVDFDRALQLQRRLASEVAEQGECRLAVLLCEHNHLITIGRSGSRAHIRRTSDQLRKQGINISWVGRGGGCVPHARGQLAVYPIVPLRDLGWSVGQYARRLQLGIRDALERFQVNTSVRNELFGIWGQSGLLAAAGIAVQNWVTTHGVFLNVHPAMTLFHHVDTAFDSLDPRGKGTMSSLLAERRLAVKMSSVRAAVVESLVNALGCTQHNVHAAHPWLRKPTGAAGEPCPNI